MSSRHRAVSARFPEGARRLLAGWAARPCRATAMVRPSPRLVQLAFEYATQPLHRRPSGEAARRDRRARQFLLRTKVRLMSPVQNLRPDTPAPLPSIQPPPSGRPAPVGRRRMVEAIAGIAVIAAWLVSGSLLRLGFLDVVLLGVLLRAAFQTLVRRRPLRTLLVRDTAS